MARLLNMRPDTEVEPNLGDHLQHLRKENQSTRSVRERRLTVLRAARWFGHPVAEASKDDLIRWQGHRMDVDHLSPAGMHNEAVHVGCYLRWLVKTERRADDPTTALVRPRHPHRGVPHPMADADIGRALATALDPDLHAWIGLGAFCGLRCMEMAKMRRDEILEQGAASKLRIIGKGGKERIVPLPESLRVELAAGPFNLEGHLFSRMDGKPGPPSAMRVSERINDHLHDQGIALTAHALRHRFGTEMYRLTRDPFKVADLMGHASVDTTRGYTLLADDGGAQLAEAVAQLRLIA